MNMTTSVAQNSTNENHPTSIKLGVSFHFHNKENRAPSLRWCKHHEKHDDCWVFGAFQTVDYTPRQIADHVLAGNAISIAAHRDNWRKKANFISTQIMGLDFDNNMSVAQLAADDMAGRYAFLIYATPSSTPEKPKSRALFILDVPITEPAQYTRLLKRLMYHYGQTGAEADKACKDTSRLFYGSANAEHIFKGIQ